MMKQSTQHLSHTALDLKKQKKLLYNERSKHRHENVRIVKTLEQGPKKVNDNKSNNILKGTIHKER